MKGPGGDCLKAERKAHWQLGGAVLDGGLGEKEAAGLGGRGCSGMGDNTLGIVTASTPHGCALWTKLLKNMIHMQRRGEEMCVSIARSSWLPLCLLTSALDTGTPTLLSRGARVTPETGWLKSAHQNAPQASSISGGGGGVLSLQTPTHRKQILTQTLAQAKSNLNEPRPPRDPPRRPPPHTHTLNSLRTRPDAQAVAIQYSASNPFPWDPEMNKKTVAAVPIQHPQKTQTLPFSALEGPPIPTIPRKTPIF